MISAQTHRKNILLDAFREVHSLCRRIHANSNQRIQGTPIIMDLKQRTLERKESKSVIEKLKRGEGLSRGTRGWGTSRRGARSKELGRTREKERENKRKRAKKVKKD